NFIFFDEAASFDAQVDRLAEALSTDIVWIRKHTELSAQAHNWSAAGKPSGLLLRSPVLEDAERWIAARPDGAPAPTETTQAFVAESRRGASRRRNLLTASLAGGLVLTLALAAAALWQRNTALHNEVQAKAERDRALTTQSLFLADLARQQ